MPSLPPLDTGTGVWYQRWTHPLLSRQHTFRIAFTFAGTIPDFAASLDGKTTAATAAISAPFDETINFSEVEVVFATPAGDAGQRYVTTQAGGAGPAQLSVAPCAPVVTKQAGLRGRTHRGRMFLPFLAESEVNVDGTMTGTVRADLQAAVQDWAGEIVDGTIITDFIILNPEPLKHYAPGDTDNPLNPSDDPWVQTGWSNTALQWTSFPNSLSVNDRVGTQRLRLRR